MMKNRRLMQVPAFTDPPPDPTPPPTWGPLDDVGAVSLLLLPGGYLPNGAGAGFGRWSDVSGNGYNADQVAGGAGIVDDGAGCPVFGGGDALLVTKSLGVELAAPDNGTVIVVSKQTAPLHTFDGTTYDTPGTVSGSGATPLLSQDDTGATLSGYDLTDYVRAFAPSGVAAAGVSHIQAGAWDTIGMYAACDEDAFGAVAPYHAGRASLSAGNIGINTYVGRSFARFFAGTIYAVAVYPTKQANAKIAQWRAWAIAQGLI